MQNFLNKYWCHDNFGICYPLLKEINIAIPISEQKGYNNEYGRYWTKPVLKINDKHYIICSQWFSEFQEKLDKWVAQNNIIDTVDTKVKIYVLPKIKTRRCPICGNKTEREIINITYHTLINRLFTLKCNNCHMIYMSDAVFKTYAQNKNIEDMNVEFIKKDTF